jgi:hypothetical protein
MAKVETDKKKPDDIWKATKENIDNDFEETRRCLLSSYHTYIQTHAGIIIALLIGFFTVISSFDAFLKNGFWQIQTFLFIGLIVGIIIAVAYMLLRIVYWVILVNVAITIPIDSVLDHFNKFNKTYSSKAPNTNIITHAICEKIKFEKNKMPCYKKLALKTAGKRF